MWLFLIIEENNPALLVRTLYPLQNPVVGRIPLVEARASSVVVGTGRPLGVLRQRTGGLVQDQALFGILEINDAENGAITLADHRLFVLIRSCQWKKENRPRLVAVHAGPFIGTGSHEDGVHDGFERLVVGECCSTVRQCFQNGRQAL